MEARSTRHEAELAGVQGAKLLPRLAAIASSIGVRRPRTTGDAAISLGLQMATAIGVGGKAQHVRFIRLTGVASVRKLAN